ncbi:glycoside hydrolase family 130 protein [Gorillibacterium timonense]|uniref:glycoside hydrolase family 130 protein n=1 Tax=Gorillibacterium timonense TaxID=1689269 RepID=UPI00071DFEB9|nr:glycoside hydrolase family 130 protein [Gorillibacterium timonense]
MALIRSESNPILTCQDVPPSREGWEVIGVFNAGVARLKDEVILLLRVAERPVPGDADFYLTPLYNPDTKELEVCRIPREGADFSDPRVVRTPDQNYLTSISHIRLARSRDGIRFEVEAIPALEPASEYEAYGIEDPRITPLEGGFIITYSAVSQLGIVVPLVYTEDFRSFERRGLIFHPDNKDVVLFPEKIGGKYYALHRPSISHYAKPDMWIAESPDLEHWGHHRHVAGIRPGKWDDTRIGASAVPIRTEQGWLELYHGADSHNRYCMGAMLFDLEEPWKLIARCELPFMEPEEPYETDGFFGNVIFACGALLDGETIRLYYGAADSCMAYAEVPLADVLGTLSPSSKTGKTENSSDGGAEE